MLVFFMREVYMVLLWVWICQHATKPTQYPFNLDKLKSDMYVEKSFENLELKLKVWKCAEDWESIVKDDDICMYNSIT